LLAAGTLIISLAQLHASYICSNHPSTKASPLRRFPSGLLQ
jgi:hypothetical protein